MWTHQPAGLSPHRHGCTGGDLEVWGTGEWGHVGVQIPTAPSELFCPVFWCGVQSKWKLFMYRAVWSCLITRPYNDCCNSRCPGLQCLEIPCVRNVGLGLESWNFIWEHLSICQKGAWADQQIWVSLGLDELARVWCSWKTQCAKGFKAPLGQGRRVALNMEINWASCSWFAFFSGLELFCNYNSKAQCFEMWPKLQNTVVSLS